MMMPIRQSVRAAEASTFNTKTLRQHFLITDLFAPGAINLTYSHLDRTIVGGAMPGSEALQLRSSKPVGSDPFLSRRELGVYNIGGSGQVAIDGESHVLNPTDCLYVPKGIADVRFHSADPGNPARYYLVSTPAHHAYTVRRITADEANRLDLGEAADANKRILRQYIHPDICSSCQLVMGMTTILEGSVWNTMPCHVHDRRSEVYLYFDMAEQTRVVHLMGEPSETRHLIVSNEQAVLSPGWSIHSGAGTGRYSFVWSMAGDNQDFADMDFIAMEDLR